VRRAYELWNAEEERRWLETFHPDIQFSPSGAFPGFDPQYHGREGLSRFRKEKLEAWEYFRIEVQAIDDRGDWLGITLRFWGKGKEGGVEVNLDFHHAMHIRDGLIDFLASRESLEEALKTAGFPE
jgi:ketosteroid isomerase-like protein